MQAMTREDTRVGPLELLVGVADGRYRALMASGTAIEWTDATWNPTTGCRKVSPGCDHCYAATLAKRLKAMGNPRYQKDGPDGLGFGLTLHRDKIEEPLGWAAPRRVFVNSMSDLFHPAVSEAFLRDVYSVMARCPQHQFQVLTKRPARMAQFVPRVLDRLRLQVPQNVWLGTSIESNEYLDRAMWLRKTPAKVRFLSLEPLLGPLPDLDLAEIDWVIVGGESGPRHRPMDPRWVREIRDRCREAGVRFFFKQWGGRTPKAGGRILDRRTWDEMPRA